MPDTGKSRRSRARSTALAPQALIAGFPQNQAFSIVELPKFTFSFDFPLNGVLKTWACSMRSTRDGDFSDIDGARDLVHRRWLHKAFIGVNEAGTEAAAATSVIIGITARSGDTITINRRSSSSFATMPQARFCLSAECCNRSQHIS